VDGGLESGQLPFLHGHGVCGCDRQVLVSVDLEGEKTFQRIVEEGSDGCFCYCGGRLVYRVVWESRGREC
jgi:hypothetical protein